MPRLKGSNNKNKDRLLRLIKDEYPDFDPILDLVRISNDSETSTADKIKCDVAISKYVYPQLKAVEHKIETESEIPTEIEITIVTPPKREDTLKSENTSPGTSKPFQTDKPSSQNKLR
ncbi:MAG: hypothetical protein KZQ70_15185 [gamma proteobacterium symbiont of Lucinoma myriamae]|nr:hypothetical protein [gamma proteobacterium symbiont of Lucinoma myriamae]MCU7833537.1 hypothetical protein [gamma proteobacterium symbiont of Lucinoma myriamae]